MLSHLAEQLRLADGRCVEIGGRERSGDAPDAHGTGYLIEFRLEAGLPVWRYDVEGLVIEKRLFLPHMQNTVHVMYELLVGRRRVRAGAAPVGELPRRRKRRSASRSAGRTSSAPSASSTRSASTGSPLPPLRLQLCGRRRDVHARRQAHRQRALSGRGEPRLSGARRSVEPGLLPADAARRAARATLVASTESFETMTRAGAGRRRSTPSATGASGCSRRPCPTRARRRRRGARARRRSVHHHAGRPHRGSGARARLRRRSAHGHRRLSLVHRLGPRHDDQPRGADARRPAATSRRATSCGRSRTTCATASSRTCFPKARSEGLYHTADATLWFFHADRPLRRSAPAIG